MSVQKAKAEFHLISMERDNLDGYVSKFERLARLAGYDLNSSLVLDRFGAALTPGLYAAIINGSDEPVTWTDWVRAAQKYQQKHLLVQANLGDERTKDPVTGQKNRIKVQWQQTLQPKSEDSDAMEIDRVKIRQTVTNKRTKSGNSGECFACHKRGHLSRDCPQRPSQPRTNAHASTSQVKVEDDEEEEDAPKTKARVDKTKYSADEITKILKNAGNDDKDKVIQTVLTTPEFWKGTNPTAWVRAFGGTTRYRSMKVPVSFRTLHAMVDKDILVDSGATDNFIHPKLLKRIGLGVQVLDRPRKIWNIDGTTNRAGQLTSFVDLEVRTGKEERKMRFLVTDFGDEDLILHPFLTTYHHHLLKEICSLLWILLWVLSTMKAVSLSSLPPSSPNFPLRTAILSLSPRTNSLPSSSWSSTPPSPCSLTAPSSPGWASTPSHDTVPSSLDLLPLLTPPSQNWQNESHNFTMRSAIFKSSPATPWSISLTVLPRTPMFGRSPSWTSNATSLLCPPLLLLCFPFPLLLRLWLQPRPLLPPLAYVNQNPLPRLLPHRSSPRGLLPPLLNPLRSRFLPTRLLLRRRPGPAWLSLTGPPLLMGVTRPWL
jgi:hypothetical protein